MDKKPDVLLQVEMVRAALQGERAMTMTIDISPETEAWLGEEAQKRGQERELVAKLALEAFSTRQREEGAERSQFADWQTASYRLLWELWDNEQDAVYDKL